MIMEKESKSEKPKEQITPDDLLNYSEISRIFHPGNRSFIRKDRLPKKWQEPMKELRDFLQYWMDKQKDKY